MVSVVIPTYNASRYLPALLPILRGQSINCELIIIDSDSDQQTKLILAESGIRVVSLRKEEFNHGSTRNIGLNLASHEIVVFLTQDALPQSFSTIEKLTDILFNDLTVAMSYGRQIPYAETGPFGTYARNANYPATSLIKNKALIPTMGIKTCSCSNSFAAYRKRDLLAVGGFPSDTILGEDVSVAARFILADKSVAYCAEAVVYHSHDYTVWEEFKRYFDIGVFHNEQKEVLREFNRAEKQGIGYFKGEIDYLRREGLQRLIPAQIVRTVAKYTGYKLGLWEEWIPVAVKRSISMHHLFWK